MKEYVTACFAVCAPYVAEIENALHQSGVGPYVNKGTDNVRIFYVPMHRDTFRGTLLPALLKLRIQVSVTPVSKKEWSIALSEIANMQIHYTTQK